MKRVFVFIVFFICLTFQSCWIALVVPKDIEWNELKFRAPEKNGIIFGTFSSQSPIALYRAYRGNLIQTNIPTKKKKRLNYLIEFVHENPCCLKNHKHNGDLDNGQTYFFITELKEGQYEMNSLNLDNSDTWVKNENITNFSYPIDVKKGKIKYIGNLSLDEYNIEGDSAIKVYDNFEKDFKGIQAYVKNIDWNSIDKTSEIKIKYVKK